VEVSQTNNPFTGKGWEGWEITNVYSSKGKWEIYTDGVLFRECQLIGGFPTPEIARQISELIEAAVAGQAIPSRKDVAELVEIGASLCAQLEENWENPSGALVLLAEIKEKYAL